MNTQERIKKFLDSVLATETFVSIPRNPEDGNFVVFLTKKEYDDYINKNQDSEFIRIWEHHPIAFTKPKTQFGFSYWVEDPGVYMHKDGSGTPPSSELVEYKELYDSLPELLSAVCQFVTKSFVKQAMDIWNEFDMEK